VLKPTLVAGGAVAALLSVVPAAKADTWDEKTVFTFNAPVEVPGRVLAPGAYVFKLADSASNRQIVQIFSRDEKHVLGTYLTVPDYRLRPTSDTRISLEERSAGEPEAVRSWFYPGQTYGHQFVYGKPKTIEVARMTVETFVPIPSVTDAKPQEVKEDPAPLTVAMAQPPANPAAPQTVEESTPVESAPVLQAKTLPRTASSAPLAGLLGVFLLTAAGVLRRLSPSAKG
jgi:hypothetical protein